MKIRWASTLYHTLFAHSYKCKPFVGPEKSCCEKYITNHRHLNMQLAAFDAPEQQWSRRLDEVRTTRLIQMYIH